MDDTTADSLADFLSKWGYTPVRTNTLQMLVPILQSSKYVQIIFQFMEFKEQEFSLLQAIREKFPVIPIFATSPFISVRDSFKVAKAGATEYLMQPFDPLYLKRIFERYTESSCP
jgi:DNA-binding response OmpR family regulator